MEVIVLLGLSPTLRLQPAPYIFNSIADLVELILWNNYHIPGLLHYLGDNITAGLTQPPSMQTKFV